MPGQHNHVSYNASFCTGGQWWPSASDWARRWVTFVITQLRPNSSSVPLYSQDDRVVANDQERRASGRAIVICGGTMKRNWTHDELVETFILLPEEQVLLEHKTPPSQLGFAALLKFVQHEGRFPTHRHEIPPAVITHLADQLGLDLALAFQYEWQGRTVEQHRAQIRTFLGLRESTSHDLHDLADWLCTQVAPQENRLEHIKAAADDRLRSLHIELPAPKHLDRFIDSALNTFEQTFYTTTFAALSETTRNSLDALVVTSVDALTTSNADEAESSTPGHSIFHTLKQDPGALSLKAVLDTAAKLIRLRQLELPATLFRDVAPRIVTAYRDRVAAEPPREVRRHTDQIRATLLACFCWDRTQEITDQLVDMLIDIIHRIGARAERRIERAYIAEIKRVRGKARMYYNIADAALEHPDGIVSEVVFPAAGGETNLRAIVEEYRASATFEEQVHTTMRASYGRHYRRMVPAILRVLTFHSNNAIHRPVIQALELLTRYADSEQTYYSEVDDVPLAGVVPEGWRDLVVHETNAGKARINRISYELCVLNVLREKLRCKEIWLQGARRHRNPDLDLPLDFSECREAYYAALKWPLDATAFITKLQQDLAAALGMLNRGLPKNTKVVIVGEHPRGTIRLSPLEAQPEGANLLRLKTEIMGRWPMTSLLDMLKEVDLRIHFTQHFKSARAREALDRRTLQRRLLLCLYALGTNTGLKRICTGQSGEDYRDLLYVRRHYLSKDQLRSAITDVVNALFGTRRTDIWGEGTTACASDSKKFSAWDQNLLTEWHIRYRGPGIMVYWHVDRKAACIYSQVKSCSSSEVAAMIEGVLRHCTEMEIDRQYVDSHGQSVVAFAFCYLLGFQLLPRLKAIPRQKLYRPFAGDLDRYPRLKPVLSKHAIDWSIIAQQYDELIKYATALRVGTADAEAILRRFRQGATQHPTYTALIELGKVIKTIFLCQFLHSEALRHEIHAGLNVVENWHSANGFIFYGKGGEIATNRGSEQELAILSLHLLQMVMVLINTVMIQTVLQEPTWKKLLTVEDYRALTPLIYGHVNPYGLFWLDLDQRLLIEPDQAA